MGGKAFSLQSHRHRRSAAIECVRILDALYPTVLSRFTTLLQPYFASIASPAPAPGKKDHGDIDILAYEPKFDNVPLIKGQDEYGCFISKLSSVLGAKAVIRDKPTSNFAVYVPEVGGHVQLDVHVCPDESNFESMKFNHAYGDSWNILNTCARYAGLSANADGLRLIIEHDDFYNPSSNTSPVLGQDEISQAKIEGRNSSISETVGGNGKKTLLVLTTSPKEILDFWGLQPEKWSDGFASTEELFDYLSTNRFLRTPMFARERLIYRDRRRMGKRPMFDNWVEQYIPSRPHLALRGAPLDKEAVRSEALERFGKWAEYEATIRKIHAERGEKGIWMNVASQLREKEEVGEDEVGVLIRGLKKVAYEEAGTVLDKLAESKEEELEEFLRKRKEAIDVIVERSWKDELEDVRRTRADYKSVVKTKKKKLKSNIKDQAQEEVVATAVQAPAA